MKDIFQLCTNLERVTGAQCATKGLSVLALLYIHVIHVEIDPDPQSILEKFITRIRT